MILLTEEVEMGRITVGEKPKKRVGKFNINKLSRYHGTLL
jgi:hypothetical protein